MMRCCSIRRSPRRAIPSAWRTPSRSPSRPGAWPIAPTRSCRATWPSLDAADRPRLRRLAASCLILSIRSSTARIGSRGCCLAASRLVQLRIKDRPACGDSRRDRNGARRSAHTAGAQLVVNDYWAQRSSSAAISSISARAISIRPILPPSAAPGSSSAFRPMTRPSLPARLRSARLCRARPDLSHDSEEMAFAPQGLARIGEWKKKIGAIPLVAIGGITLERAPGVFEAGADIVSVVTDITLAADPEARARDWVEATRGRAPGSPVRREPAQM